MTVQSDRNEPNERREGLHRRDVIKGDGCSRAERGNRGARTGQCRGRLWRHPIPPRRTRSSVRTPRPGTRDWLLTTTDIADDEPVTLWRSPRIEGYCSQTSVSAGEVLKIMVSTNPVSEFSLEIFRTGYYGGDGGRP